LSGGSLAVICEFSSQIGVDYSLEFHDSSRKMT
jgi:hypothetical protein